MKVERFSKEIIKIGDTFVALSTIYAIESIYLFGMRGYGDVCYTFLIKTCLGAEGKVNIYGSPIEYYELSYKEFDFGREDEHPIYADKKIELMVVRDETIEIWNEYLESK
jgi:hypothetical protein